MLGRLKNLFTGSPPKGAPPSGGRSTAHRASAPPVSVANIYPPDDQGLPLRSVEELLKGNLDLINRLRVHAATNEEDFDSRYIEPIRRLAAHINTLPGSPSSLFSGEAGLLRACLELGFVAFQASDGRIFTGNATVEARHKLEPRWRYICFVAGLMYPMGIPLSRMVVAASATGSSAMNRRETTGVGVLEYNAGRRVSVLLHRRFIFGSESF